MKRLAILIWLLMAQPAWADRLFTTGFEENDTGWTTTMWSSVTGAGNLSYDAVTVHSGTYSMKITVAPSIGWVERQFSTAGLTTGEVWYRWYLNVGTDMDATSAIANGLNTTTGQNWQVQEIVTTHVVRLLNAITSTSDDSSFALSTGTQYRFELRHLLSDTVGELELRIYLADGTTPLDTLLITGEDTIVGSAAKLRLGVSVSHNFTGYFDDVAINNDATNHGAATYVTSWPGPGKIALVKPTSDDTVTWTKTGTCSATTNTDCVDEVPGTPDGDTTYNASSATGGDEDRLNKTALPAEVTSDADMKLIHVYARNGGTGTTGTRTSRLLLWDDVGSQTLGDTSNNCDSAAAAYLLTLEDDDLVLDLGTRTKATVDDADFDIGYENISNHSCTTTALWGNVEWIEAAGAAVVSPRRTLTFE